MNLFEYALFRITDRAKFQEFMSKYLSMNSDTEEFGFRVQVLGCGKEPFDTGPYIDYLDEIKAIDSSLEFYLTLDEWVRMSRPKTKSVALAKKIEIELT